MDNEDIVTLIALERQDLSRTYLAHHELESIVIMIIMVMVPLGRQNIKTWL